MVIGGSRKVLSGFLPGGAGAGRPDGLSAFERMPDVKKQELEERKKGFQESYERLRDSWK